MEPALSFPGSRSTGSLLQGKIASSAWSIATVHHVGTEHAIKVVLVHTHLRAQHVRIVPSEATLYLRLLQLLVGHHHVLGVRVALLSFGIGR